jgi:hypothetical protein
METNQIQRAPQQMASFDFHASAKSPFAITTLAWLIAALLILLGITFEMGMLGFGPYNSNDAWMFAVAGKNAWIMLANLEVPQLIELVRTWPMALVVLGSGILLTAELWRRAHSISAAGFGRKERHGN